MLVVTASLLFLNLFPATIERAFILIQNQDWSGAASSLDQAAIEDPQLFQANSFPYLRGRVAEHQTDWERARTEFLKIPADNALRPLAVWHAAMSAARLQDHPAVASLFRELPSSFPDDFKLQLAGVSATDVALTIYSSMAVRDARLERARMVDDKIALWSLLRERKDDDTGLRAAHLLSAVAATPREMLEVADAFTAHRQFDYAQPLYESAAQDSAVAAESRFQIARIYFLRGDFASAGEAYSSIAKDFPGTRWERDSDYQVASCYWRLGDFNHSEKAYLRYITKYGSRGQEEGAIRNLVDVYRVLGENQKALTWIDRALAKRLTVAGRQVFLFTKAKILYAQKRYTAAAQLFRQLALTTIRSAPGGTTKDEARYFEALSLSQSGNAAAAKTIWRRLSLEPHTYYGARAAERLGLKVVTTPSELCQPSLDKALAQARTDLDAIRRPIKSSLEASTDLVTELMFLQLWDEAAFWKERFSSRVDNRASAQLAYAGGRYHRAIAYAEKLARSDSATQRLYYPAGFRQLICAESNKNTIDPLWLHAIIWQESKYNPYARSGASARGLMQFIPETANQVGAAIGLSEFSLEKLYDPAVNIPMGAHYWSSLMNELKSPVMALAAYNGGIDNVRRWKSKWPAGDDEFFVADIGFVETKRYVMAVYGARVAYGSLP